MRINIQRGIGTGIGQNINTMFVVSSTALDGHPQTMQVTSRDMLQLAFRDLSV
jgi:hypothetical protein